MTLSNFTSADDSLVEPTLFQWSGQENHVNLSGSFQLFGVDDWTPIAMEKGQETFCISLNLKPGEYQYKFVVDGNWTCDFQADTVTDSSGNVNNRITVPETVVTSAKDSSGPVTSPATTTIESEIVCEVPSPLPSIISASKPNQSETVFILENQTSESPEQQLTILSKQTGNNLNEDHKFSPSLDTLAPEFVETKEPNLTTSSSAKPSQDNYLDSRTLDNELQDLTSPIHDNIFQLELVEEDSIESSLPKHEHGIFQNNPLDDNASLASTFANSKKDCDLTSNPTNMETSLNDHLIQETTSRKDSVTLENTTASNEILSSPDEIDGLSNMKETPLQEEAIPSKDIERHGNQSDDVRELAVNKDAESMPSTEEINLDSLQENEVKTCDESQSDQQESSVEVEVDNPASVVSDVLAMDDAKAKEPGEVLKNECFVSLPDSSSFEPEHGIELSAKTVPGLNEESLKDFNSSTETNESLKQSGELASDASDSSINLINSESLDLEESTPLLITKAHSVGATAKLSDYDELVTREPEPVVLECSDSLNADVNTPETEDLLVASTEETVLGSDDLKTTIHLEVLKSSSSSNTITLEDEFAQKKLTFVSLKTNLSCLSESNPQDQPKSVNTSHETILKYSKPNSPNLDLNNADSVQTNPQNVVFLASKFLFFGVVALLEKFYKTFTWGLFYKIKKAGHESDTKGGSSKDNALEKVSSLSELSIIEIIAGFSLVIIGLSAALIISALKLSV